MNTLIKLNTIQYIMNLNKTLITKQNQNTKWYIIDAKKYKLGRISSAITYILKNKHHPYYLPYTEGNSKIIIINSQSIQVTGKKFKQKQYKRHSGRPGGLKTETFEQLQKRIPNRIVEHALKGMLPKNSLGRKLFTKVKIYPNAIHPHHNKNITEINIK